MENYLQINGRKFELSAEQSKELAAQFAPPQIQLSLLQPAETFWVGKHEFVVLEQSGETTAVILKGLLYDGMEFGNTNRYDGSNADKACNRFAEEITAEVGSENLVEHTVDLTSDDGLKDYGVVERQVSLLTTDLYRRYVDTLDAHKVDKWWWLATPHSTKRHESDSWVKCVAPSGIIINDGYDYDFGVRPFCILKSDIFVSK